MLSSQVDIGVTPGKPHHKPFLRLAPIAPAPNAAGKIGWQVIAQPPRALGEDLGFVRADFLLQLAKCGLPRGLASIDPALRHLPSRQPRHIDPSGDKNFALPVEQHDPDSRTIAKGLRLSRGHPEPRAQLMTRPLNKAMPRSMSTA